MRFFHSKTVEGSHKYWLLWQEELNFIEMWTDYVVSESDKASN